MLSLIPLILICSEPDTLWIWQGDSWPESATLPESPYNSAEWVFSDETAWLYQACSVWYKAAPGDSYPYQNKWSMLTSPVSVIEPGLNNLYLLHISISGLIQGACGSGESNAYIRLVMMPGDIILAETIGQYSYNSAIEWPIDFVLEDLEPDSVYFRLEGYTHALAFSGFASSTLRAEIDTMAFIRCDSDYRSLEQSTWARIKSVL